MPSLTKKMSLKEAGKLFIALDGVERDTGKVTRYPQPEKMRGTYLVIGVGEVYLHFSYERKKDTFEQITCDWFARNDYQLRKARKLVKGAIPRTQKDIEYALMAPHIPSTEEVHDN